MSSTWMGGEEGKCSSQLDEIKPSRRPFLVLFGKINHALIGKKKRFVVEQGNTSKVQGYNLYEMLYGAHTNLVHVG